MSSPQHDWHYINTVFKIDNLLINDTHTDANLIYVCFILRFFNQTLVSSISYQNQPGCR